MSTRATLIKLVHAGARQLFDDEDSRRAWQRQRTGKESCRDMSDAQLDALVGELRRKGALAPARPAANNPQARKIYALWADLKACGAIKSADRKALGTWLKKLTGRYNPEWLGPDDANTAIEALKAWRRRWDERGAA